MFAVNLHFNSLPRHFQAMIIDKMTAPSFIRFGQTTKINANRIETSKILHPLMVKSTDINLFYGRLMIRMTSTKTEGFLVDHEDVLAAKVQIRTETLILIDAFRRVSHAFSHAAIKEIVGSVNMKANEIVLAYYWDFEDEDIDFIEMTGAKSLFIEKYTMRLERFAGSPVMKQVRRMHIQEAGRDQSFRAWQVPEFEFTKTCGVDLDIIEELLQEWIRCVRKLDYLEFYCGVRRGDDVRDFVNSLGAELIGFNEWIINQYFDAYEDPKSAYIQYDDDRIIFKSLQ